MREVKAQYRAYSDVISVDVCSACASEAWTIGLSIAALEGAQQSNADGTAPIWSMIRLINRGYAIANR